MSRTRLTVSILMAAGVLLISGATLVWAFPLKTSVQDVEASAVSSMAVSAEGAVAANASPTGNSVAAETNPGQEGTKVYKVGDNVKAPEAIYKQQPRYTREAKKNHVTGKVELLCTIDAKGNVSEINEVSKPLGAGLDESAITAVRNWKYKPATRDGVSVPVKTTITINFTLLEKSGKDSQKSTSAIDPPAQTEQKRPDAAKDNGPSVKINQAELQRQIEQAMKQARIAQQAVPKIDEAEIQRQVEEAMRQAKIAQDAASKIDQAKIQQQVEKAMRQLQKLNMPEMRQKMQEQMKQLEKLNTSEMRQQRKQALEQARIAQQAAAKIDKAEIRRQIEQAKRQVEEAKRQTQQARHQKEAARKEAEKARHDAEKQRKEIEPPLPPASPSPQELMPAPPAPPSPQGLVPHPPAPPSPPAPSQNH